LLENQKTLANRLLVAAQEGAPLVRIKGPEGAGITTLARWLYDSLPVSSHFALLLAPGAAGVMPSALTGKIIEAVKNLPGAPQNAVQPDASVRDQALALAPVFDLVQKRGKRIAVILDNAGFLSGEPWSAYFLAMIRQGELVDPVIQFFLFGSSTEMERIAAEWPRALQARSTAFNLSVPGDESMVRWLRNRLVLAGLTDTRAVSLFPPVLASRAVRAANGSLTRLGRIAGAALVEAFLAGRTIVERSDLDAVLSAGSETPGGADAGGSARRQRNRDLSRESDGNQGGNVGEGTGIPRLIDLVKSN
jgi:hypothetical protein